MLIAAMTQKSWSNKRDLRGSSVGTAKIDDGHDVHNLYPTKCATSGIFDDPGSIQLGSRRCYIGWERRIAVDALVGSGLYSVGSILQYIGP